MCRQAFLINPTVYSVAGHTEVGHDFLDREPPFARRNRLISGLILHQSYILSETRNPENRLFSRAESNPGRRGGLIIRRVDVAVGQVNGFGFAL
jgi:hypothetical protein